MAERDQLRHGGLTVTTVREADGRITVSVAPAGERVTIRWVDHDERPVLEEA